MVNTISNRQYKHNRGDSTVSLGISLSSIIFFIYKNWNWILSTIFQVFWLIILKYTFSNWQYKLSLKYITIDYIFTSFFYSDSNTLSKNKYIYADMFFFRIHGRSFYIYLPWFGLKSEKKCNLKKLDCLPQWLKLLFF